jgi:hypothetical protein
MRQAGLPSRFTFVILVVALISPQWSSLVASQNAPFRIYSPYWRESGGFTTTLIVRNIHRTLPTRVRPILYATDGREIQLHTLELAANSVQSHALRDLLAAAGV